MQEVIRNKDFRGCIFLGELLEEHSLWVKMYMSVRYWGSGDYCWSRCDKRLERWRSSIELCIIWELECNRWFIGSIQRMCFDLGWFVGNIFSFENMGLPRVGDIWFWLTAHKDPPHSICRRANDCSKIMKHHRWRILEDNDAKWCNSHLHLPNAKWLTSMGSNCFRNWWPRCAFPHSCHMECQFVSGISIRYFAYILSIPSFLLAVSWQRKQYPIHKANNVVGYFFLRRPRKSTFHQLLWWDMRSAWKKNHWFFLKHGGQRSIYKYRRFSRFIAKFILHASFQWCISKRLPS